MDSQIQKVKDAVDIVALISERVKLTRAGKNYKGLCPFHSEKSPSFFVTPELGRYKCFGCQESGDCFTFLQKVDSLTFAESLRELAKRAGITLDSIPYTSEDKKKERLLEALSLAREYYHYLLMSHDIGEEARNYLKDRGIKKDTAELFGLGFSPGSWDGLQKYLVGKKGFTNEVLLDAGLILQSSRGSFYDRFRGRIMFPLTTHRGQVVGFSGRMLSQDAKEAKYINSPETSLYHKSELLFGYSQLSKFIRDSEEVIVCEGEFDMLSSFQAHVEQVVAIKGSALTQQQLKLLARSAKRIIFALDSDKAGIEATKRAIELVRESEIDINLRIIPLLGGKDPDDIAKNDPALWREMTKKSVSVYEYLISVAFGKWKDLTGDAKREITKELAPLLSQITNAVEQAHYVQQVSKKLGVSEDVFLAELRKMQSQGARGKGQGDRQRAIAKPEKPKTRAEVLEQYVLILLFASDPQIFARRYEELKVVTLGGIYKKLFEALKPFASYFDAHQVENSLPEELKDQFASLYLEAASLEESQDGQKEFEQALEELLSLTNKGELKRVAKRVSELELSESLSRAEEEELKSLRAKLQSLQA